MALTRSNAISRGSMVRVRNRFRVRIRYRVSFRVSLLVGGANRDSRTQEGRREKV